LISKTTHANSHTRTAVVSGDLEDKKIALISAPFNPSISTHNHGALVNKIFAYPRKPAKTFFISIK
jgi:hypothetical protein